MSHDLSKVQEIARKLETVAKLRREFLVTSLIDVISINAKTVLMGVVCCLAMVTIFKELKLDPNHLTPAGIVLGISIYLGYTRPKQRDAAFVRKLHLAMKLSEEKIIDLTKDPQ